MSESVTVALLYDFDKTLCTKDMQEYTFIPNLDMTATEFWKKSNSWSIESQMDKILAYMYTMLHEAKYKNKSINRNSFEACGKNIEYYPGVETDWFSHINAFGKIHNLKVEHYIISSGLKEIIEGSSIGKEFKEIFACEFLYDGSGAAVWPKNTVNYTEKTQYLFRINKGVLDISNDADLNASTPLEERRIPFRNMIYFGDGMTDVPCMKLVHINGGKSIAVYPGNTPNAYDGAKHLLIDDRVDFLEVADYRVNSALTKLVERILVNMATNHELIQYSKQQLKHALG